MIRLPDHDLPAATQQKLDIYQQQVDASGTFSERVIAAKMLFKKQNTARNATFRVIRNVLDKMCSGARRCCYCEDSVADEVEHVRPKDWYPEFVFVWSNFLYACGPCNGPKNNKFSVFHWKNGKPVELTRAKDGPITKLTKGDPLLIDPRSENPLHFLELDLDGTFLFLPRPQLTQREIKRAEYTIALLKLNERDVLLKARKNAFGTYHARLEQYTVHKESGKLPATLYLLVRDLQQVPHPTVWAEMKRQQQYYPHLKDLFERSPEALDW